MSNSNKVLALYGPCSNIDINNTDYRLSPAPMISMSTEFNYGNDTIIGYSNIINLNGYLFNSIEGDTSDLDYGKRHFGLNLQRMEKLRSLLSHNGYCLYIFNTNENSNTSELILKAKGGTLRSFTFDKNDNNWTSNIKYTASLEFNEIEFIGETLSCPSGEVDQTNYITNLVTSSQHKIKSFSDNWGFVVNDDSFAYHNKIDNTRIQVSYNVSAVGKHYYSPSESTLPAHEQARKFVQKMLVDRIASFTNNDLFEITGSGACGSHVLNDLHQHDHGGIIGLSGFLRYNDSLNIQVSESDGSVSASFSCLFKKTFNDYNQRHDAANTIHTVTSSTRKTTNAGKTQTVISIQGSIQGLVEGGVIEPGNLGQFTIPSYTSNLLIQAQSASNIKYNNAYNHYFSNVGTEEDLTDDFKTYLGVSLSGLNITPPSGCDLNEENATIKPVSFNLTHNYNEGIISYNADYDSNAVCKDNNPDTKDVTSITVSREGGSPVIAEFIIPFAGMIAQDIGTKSSTKITINVNGTKTKVNASGNRICCNTLDEIMSDISGLIGGCGSDSNFNLPSGITIPDDAIIVTKQKSEDKVTGNYSTNITYICSSGCDIK